MFNSAIDWQTSCMIIMNNKQCMHTLLLIDMRWLIMTDKTEVINILMCKQAIHAFQKKQTWGMLYVLQQNDHIDQKLVLTHENKKIWKILKKHRDVFQDNLLFTASYHQKNCSNTRLTQKISNQSIKTLTLFHKHIWKSKSIK